MKWAAGVLIIATLLVYLWHKGRQRMKKFHQRNIIKISDLREEIAVVKARYEDTTKLELATLVEEFSQSAWAKKFEHTSLFLDGLRDGAATLLKKMCGKRSWKEAYRYAEEMYEISYCVTDINALMNKASSTLEHLKSLKNNWPNQLDEFHDIFDDVEELSYHPDVGDISVDALKARKHLGQAIKLAQVEESKIDWEKISTTAIRAIGAIKHVHARAKDNIEFAKKTRSESPDILISLSEK